MSVLYCHNAQARKASPSLAPSATRGKQQITPHPRSGFPILPRHRKVWHTFSVCATLVRRLTLAFTLAGLARSPLCQLTLCAGQPVPHARRRLATVFTTQCITHRQGFGAQTPIAFCGKYICCLQDIRHDSLFSN